MKNIFKDVEQTSLWELYDRGRNYLVRMGMYKDTDDNFRMVYGDQWKDIQSGSIAPVSLNVLKPIVKYKVGTINNNLFSINFSADMVDESIREATQKACDLLNIKAAKMWEKDKMDRKIRRVSKQSCVNSEGLIYVNVIDADPSNEIINKNDVCYGNENDDNIQDQPYIIIKKRMPITKAKELAIEAGVSDEDVEKIIADNETLYEAGERSKEEVNDMVTLLTKMYKKDGTVWYKKATQYVDFHKEDVDSGLSLYPLAHMVWDDIEGSARGEGNVKYLIGNQYEINRTLMRRVLTVKLNAYPKQIVNMKYIVNKGDIDKVGVTLKSDNVEVDDVRKIFTSTVPASMSPDAKELQTNLVQDTRELDGAGDIATGQVNPEQASGKAILAVKQASQEPLTEQLMALKGMIEDLALIWLDIWRVYAENGISVQKPKEDAENEDETVTETVSKAQLESLKAVVKIDITPKGAFDKYAQELSLENLFLEGKITFDEYVESLDFDSVMPKQKLQKIMEKRKEKQEKIAAMQMAANDLEAQAGDILGQAEMPPGGQPPMPEQEMLPPE